MLLDKGKILAARDKRTETVAVPEWGDGAQVLIGSMGALAYARMMDWIETLGTAPTAEPDSEAVVSCDDTPPEADAEEPDREYSAGDDMAVVVRWCAESILDPETYHPAFTATDLDALGDKDPRPLLRIWKSAMQLNRETLESSEAFEKNSDGTAGGGSGGDSP